MTLRESLANPCAGAGSWRRFGHAEENYRNDAARKHRYIVFLGQLGHLP